MLAKAFALRRESEAGIAVTRSDVPNIVVHDLMKIIEEEVERYKHEQQQEAQKSMKRASSKV